MSDEMIEKRSWEEFRREGLLWWVNRGLHLFGWAIVLDVEPNGEVTGAYPARCKFRGFDRESEEKGFRQLSIHLAGNALRLAKEANED